MPSNVFLRPNCGVAEGVDVKEAEEAEVEGGGREGHVAIVGLTVFMQFKRTGMPASSVPRSFALTATLQHNIIMSPRQAMPVNTSVSSTFKMGRETSVLTKEYRSYVSPHCFLNLVTLLSHTTRTLYP
jgi:hypothetical protein